MQTARRIARSARLHTARLVIGRKDLNVFEKSGHMWNHHQSMWPLCMSLHIVRQDSMKQTENSGECIARIWFTQNNESLPKWIIGNFSQGINVAKNTLPATHSLRLGIALNYSGKLKPKLPLSSLKLPRNWNVSVVVITWSKDQDTCVKKQVSFNLTYPLCVLSPSLHDGDSRIQGEGLRARAERIRWCVEILKILQTLKTCRQHHNLLPICRCHRWSGLTSRGAVPRELTDLAVVAWVRPTKQTLKLHATPQVKADMHLLASDVRMIMLR